MQQSDEPALQKIVSLAVHGYETIFAYAQATNFLINLLQDELS
jgi:hypothetical protein